MKRARAFEDHLTVVMPANAGIHDFLFCPSASKAWMAGTSPAMTILQRHARECGHPRLSFLLVSQQGVDGRDKPGHDGSRFPRHARP
jgi:hypothetical protein